MKPLQEVRKLHNRKLAISNLRLVPAIQVETAYDVLLMQSMKRRIGGAVDSSVRFADVAKARPVQQVRSSALGSIVRPTP